MRGKWLAEDAARNHVNDSAGYLQFNFSPFTVIASIATPGVR